MLPSGSRTQVRNSPPGAVVSGTATGDFASGFTPCFSSRATAAVVSATTIDWHKTGFLLQLEKKWGIKKTKFAEEMNTKYK